MIFVGEGALLWRAVQHALDHNLAVDLVCGPALAAEAARPDVPYRAVADVNSVAAELVAVGTDGLVLQRFLS
ncbi:hypothetical protein ABZ070_35030 [Streptomyces sp. NPDC006283]|uniref:hypothetical protein n=1 Tax=Streptomyces sp. NPDC006283 TaxID=3156741 RepID=UPI0033AD4794